METIPYSCQNITDEDVAAVAAALRAPYLTQGPAIAEFEQAFAQHHQAAYAVAVCNATAALHIGCLALGVGPGTSVWTTPNSFVASANCALYCGADVDFVDIDPATRNIDVAALAAKLEVAQRDGRLPRVVVPVAFSGLSADLREIRALADRYGFAILEDASHAAGASYEGRPVGSGWADISVFSFHAVKIVTTAEGGMLLTQDEGLARQLQQLRSHGMTRDPLRMEREPDGFWYYEQQTLGYNYRITDLQAALGLSQLRRIESMHARRIELADRYDALLAGLPVILPPRIDGRQSSWHLYVIELADDAGASRHDVMNRLRASGIGVNVHYIPIHTQPHYQRLGFRRGDFPAAERYYARAVTLPLFPAMTEAQQDRVVGALRQAIAAG